MSRSQALICRGALFVILLLMLSDGVTATAVLRLTGEDFAEKTVGRSMFIKFFAPWCQHCEAMAADFERVAEAFEDDPIAIVAEIDCTDPDSEHLCEEYEISGYPAILYGDPDSPEEYDGVRDYESMYNFAKEHITKLPCHMGRPESCSEEENAIIADLQAKSVEELEHLEQEAESQVALAQGALDKKVEAINLQYEAAVKEFNANVDSIRSKTHYKWVQQLLSHREMDMEPAPDPEEEEEGDEF